MDRLNEAKESARLPLAVLALASAAMLAVRLYAASQVGFGDSEALYAAYALHPQPAYLDHPGMVGLFARAIAGGGAPSPWRAHVVTSILATLVPWIVALGARACGASWRRSAIAAIAFAATPDIAIGLFAMTPDLLLGLAWTSSLACAAAGLRSPPDGARATALLVAAFAIAVASTAAKVSGALLAAALVATLLSREARAHARTLAPWAGLAAGAIVVVPVAIFEARTGWPMLRHRLVDSQPGAGASLRNLGAVLGGQLAYVSPLLAVAGAIVAVDLVRDRARDVISRLLFFALVLPLVPLLAIALWSRVAEPHWLAPAWIALPLHFARGPSRVGPRLGVSALACAAALSVGAYAWVLVPSSAKLVPASADMRFDIANELYGWPRVIHVVEDVLAVQAERDPYDDTVVVGPHWVICAQLAASLGPGARVGCDTPIRDDFDDWLPRPAWRTAGTILLVTDTRFPANLDARFRDYAPITSWEVPIDRGGRRARTFTVTLLAKRDSA